jgi:predicted porin
MVGVTGNFGTAVAGYLQTAGYDWHGATSPVAGTGLDAAGRLGAATLLQGNYFGRAGNAVAYISPAFGGVTVAYNHARVTEAANAQATKDDCTANLFHVKYANGPLTAALVYSKVSADHTVASDDVKETGVSATYDLGVAKLFASHQSQKVGSGSSDSKWSASVSAPVSAAGTAHFSYGSASIDSTVASDDPSAWTLAYTHGVSKRTTAYVGYTRISNDGVGVKAVLVAPVAGGSSSMLAGGVRHTF